MTLTLKKLTILWAVVAILALLFASFTVLRTKKTLAENHQNNHNLYQYSAKFICGMQKVTPLFKPPSEPPVKPGNYATAINIHNPNDYWVGLHKKTVLAPQEPKQGQPGDWVAFELGPDSAFEIDCPDIIKLLGHTVANAADKDFLKGFVVIASPNELDVVGVYTAGSKALVNSIDVEEIDSRIIPIPNALKAPPAD